MTQPTHQSPFALDGTVTRDKLLELLAVQTELTWLDFKQACDLSGAAGSAELAKDVGAMMIHGGYLVIGADDKGVSVGSTRGTRCASTKPRSPRRCQVPVRGLRGAHCHPRPRRRHGTSASRAGVGGSAWQSDADSFEAAAVEFIRHADDVPGALAVRLGRWSQVRLLALAPVPAVPGHAVFDDADEPLNAVVPSLIGDAEGHRRRQGE